MRFNITAAVLTTAALATAKPFEFPLSNGFPAPSTDAIATIQHHAGGALPNGALPSKISKAAITAFQLVALNEIFEVAFFSELLQNVPSGVAGYKTSDQDYIKRVIRRIRAQEELHALGANGILANVDKSSAIGGLCQYEFPVTSLTEAMALAETFTAIVLAVVPGAQELFAEDGGEEIGLIPLVGSIVAQEGEQTGWFRAYQGKAPSAAPFLTGGPANFAFGALKMFIVPGSCKDVAKIDIPTTPALTVTKLPMHPRNQMISFSVEGMLDEDSDYISYLSGQSKPVTVPISNLKTKGGVTSFDASFPYVSGGFAKGLTFAAVTSGKKKPASAAEVAEAASYGPGLIILQ